jgi:hypothetical protein
MIGVSISLSFILKPHFYLTTYRQSVHVNFDYFKFRQQ